MDYRKCPDAVALALEFELKLQTMAIICLRRKQKRTKRWLLWPCLMPHRMLEYGHYNTLMSVLSVEDDNFANYEQMLPQLLPSCLRGSGQSLGDRRQVPDRQLQLQVWVQQCLGNCLGGLPSPGQWTEEQSDATVPNNAELEGHGSSVPRAIECAPCPRCLGWQAYSHQEASHVQEHILQLLLDAPGGCRSQIHADLHQRARSAVWWTVVWSIWIEGVQWRQVHQIPWWWATAEQWEGHALLNLVGWILSPWEHNS